MGRSERWCWFLLFVAYMAFPAFEPPHAAEPSENPFSSQLPKPKARQVKQPPKSAKKVFRKTTTKLKPSTTTKVAKLSGPPVPKLLDILRTSEGRFAVLVLEGRRHLAPEGARVGDFRVAMIGKIRIQLQPLSSESGTKPRVLSLKIR